MKGFIYKITNIINKKIYVGQTTQIKVENRWKQHIQKLNNNTHANDFLQHAWNKYSEKNFIFELIKEIDKNTEEDLINELNRLEELYIKQLHSMYDEHGYNLKPGGYNKKLCQYSKNKISKKNKGKIRSKESKQKNREAHLGKKWTEEQKQNLKKIRKNMIHPQLNKPISNITKEKMRKTLMKDNYIFFDDNDIKNIIIRIFINNESIRLIADDYKVSYKQIRNIKDKYFDKYKDIYNKTKKITKTNNYTDILNKKQILEIIEKYNFISIKQLAKNYKVSQYTIKKILYDNNIDTNRHYIKIQFNNKKIKEIIKQRIDGKTLKNIGKQYNVSSKVITRILIENGRKDLIKKQKSKENI